MEIKRECSLVRDLLPLFRENLTSEASSQMVNHHLKNCSACRGYMEILDGEEQEKMNKEKITDKVIKGSLKKWRYEMLGFTGAIIFMVLLILGVLVYGYAAKKDDYANEHFNKAQHYGEQDYKGISKLYLFPDKGNIKGKIEDFYYDCKGTKMYQDYQIYLKCSYSPEAYEKEKERLMGVTDTVTGRKVLFTTEENHLPCIAAMLYDEAYEYVLLSEEDSTILYIYLQGIDKRNLHFSADLLPKDYGQNGFFLETERDAFRIYPKE